MLSNSPIFQTLAHAHTLQKQWETTQQTNKDSKIIMLICDDEVT